MSVRALRGHVGTLRLVLSLLWRSSPFVCLVGLLAAVLEGTLPPFAAYFTKRLIDALTSESLRQSEVQWLALCAAAATGASGILGTLSDYVSAVVRKRLAIQVDEALFAKLLSFPGLEQYEDAEFHSRLCMAERGATEAPWTVVQLGRVTIRSTTTVVSVLGIVITISPFLATLLCISGVIGVVSQVLRVRVDLSLMAHAVRADRWREWYRALLLDPRAAKEIRLLDAGVWFLDRMLSSMRTSMAFELRIERRSMAVHLALALIIVAFTVIGARAIVSQRFTAGDVTLFFAGLVAVEVALDHMLSQLAIAGRTLGMLKSFRDVLAFPQPRAPVAALAPLRREIRFEDVWFRYSPSHPWVLRGVSFALRAGTCVGLVGLNGAGKSTLVRLLCGFYQPERGRILWDGVDISNVDPSSLRARIRATFQDFMAYELSAMENIAIGDLAASPSLGSVHRVAERVGIADALQRLPQGYETLLSRTLPGSEEAGPGTSLSGGQWQRMAIARTLLRREVDLLILDEPSSGLDPEAEYELLRALQFEEKHRTQLLISHRLGAMRNATEILVLSKGLVAERGTHEELMSLNKSYAKLFNLQARAYLDGVAGIAGQS